MPLIESAFPGAARLERRPVIDVEAAVRDVDELLSAEIEALDGQWRGYLEGLGVDVLPADLPRWLGDLLVGRGKRLRVTVAYWGFIAAGGVSGTTAYRHLIRAAAALETLHLFALVHDDVMDESECRRGRPAAHVEAERWHRDSGAMGDPAVFGRNLAILLGDLAHTVADRLIDGLPQALRDVWYELMLELIVGQRADLTGAAAGRRDRPHAEQVARLKSGRYTVVRPLQLAAVAAGAPPAVVGPLLSCGEHMGWAFALRDEYLGVWGDPEITGKPSSDDLLEAKATVVLSLARDRLTGQAAQLLERLGTPGFGLDDVAALAAAMRAAGVDVELEGLIKEAVDDALACLEGNLFTADGVDGIRAAAHAMAWRNA
ncbi:polyprenyl synthetase family protein [Tessaracoccus sp. OS52]|uniref:polyprenyl synthetase family protein n=1 Tax=Tessaracoccus sp. OS52 TaxID=2886691 RepID=UPI00351DA098